MSNAVTVVLKVGAEGGDIALVGRQTADGAWQFSRATEDQTEALFGGGCQAILAESAWVETWEAALKLMDRYPWAMLSPIEVHTEFVERVKLAVDERLARAGDVTQAQRVTGKWERMLSQHK